MSLSDHFEIDHARIDCSLYLGFPNQQMLNANFEGRTSYRCYASKWASLPNIYKANDRSYEINNHFGSFDLQSANCYALCTPFTLIFYLEFIHIMLNKCVINCKRDTRRRERQ